MFNTSFSYTLIHKQPRSERYLKTEYVYHFHTAKKRRYLLIAEEYEYNVFAVKFFPSNKRCSPHRFNLILNEFEFPAIIRTCVNLMIEILQRNPTASFAYVGVNSITPNYTEPKSVTKRFRIYEYVMDEFISTKKFKRYVSAINSAVLLFNVKNDENNSSAIINMFVDLYAELDPVFIL